MSRRTPSSQSSNDSVKSTRFVFERYPKTTLEELQSFLNDQQTSKFDLSAVRSRSHQQRFRTQPVTLTEINETDEENKIESDHPENLPTTKSSDDFQRLEHLALSDHLRRSARKKAPLKNYLERQRLKAMREETNETDGN